MNYESNKQPSICIGLKMPPPPQSRGWGGENRGRQNKGWWGHAVCGTRAHTHKHTHIHTNTQAYFTLYCKQITMLNPTLCVQTASSSLGKKQNKLLKGIFIQTDIQKTTDHQVGHVYTSKHWSGITSAGRRRDPLIRPPF